MILQELLRYEYEYTVIRLLMSEQLQSCFWRSSTGNMTEYTLPHLLKLKAQAKELNKGASVASEFSGMACIQPSG